MQYSILSVATTYKKRDIQSTCVDCKDSLTFEPLDASQTLNGPLL